MLYSAGVFPVIVVFFWILRSIRPSFDCQQVVDNASAHNDASIELSNVVIRKLLPNTTVILQPIDQGTNKCLKNEYQNKKQSVELDLFHKGFSYTPADVNPAMKWLTEGWN
ncbi:hypothetical protein DVH05_012613 [Phytophthora capsici]|nr:hypothetical protein DVH05_012613 [Phytophthora capsici]